MIYLDHHSTTPLDPRVLKIMLPYFTEKYGNPSNTLHSMGWDAAEAVERARQQVAECIGGSSNEIYFSSGATESINLAILGCLGRTSTSGHLITTAVEHKAVLQSGVQLEKQGHSVTVLPVDSYGRLDPDLLKKSIRTQTQLVSVILANNEIGTINPIEDIARVVADHGALLHVDAAQAVGRIPVNVREQGIHMLSISGHKIYGPKGVGALYVRAHDPRVRLQPTTFGAGQERGLRSGTLNVPGIVGLGEACRIVIADMKEETDRLLKFRSRLTGELFKRVDGLILNGHPAERLCNNVNFSIQGAFSDILLSALKGLAFSTGSACATGSLSGSHVLKAIGVSDDLARTTIRLGLGRFTTSEEITSAIEILVAAITKSRS